MSSCCGDTCLYEHNPEYGKCHKPENNAGCSCGPTMVDEDVLETSVVRQKLLRSDYV